MAGAPIGLQARSRRLVTPFWDPYCGLVGIGAHATMPATIDAVAIERLEEGGAYEFVGELRIGNQDNRRGPRCLWDLPFFALPRRQRLSLRFRMFAGNVVEAVEEASLDNTVPDEQLRVTGGLVWRRSISGAPPELFDADELAQMPEAAQSQIVSLLKSRAARDGRIAAATRDEMVQTRLAPRHVTVDLRKVELADRLNPAGPCLWREQVNIVVELEQPLADLPSNAFRVGFYNSTFSKAYGRELQLNYFDLVPAVSKDRMRIVFPLGTVMHQSHVFITCVDGGQVSFAGKDKPALAFLYLGSRCIFDESMSHFIWAGGQQVNNPQKALLRQHDDVVLGPAGEAAIDDFRASLRDGETIGQEASDAGRLVRTLNASGIDTSKVAQVVRHANVIHALQWPRVFRRWSNCLQADPSARLPESPLELIEQVLAFEKRTLDGLTFPDGLSAWQWFRRDSASA